MEFVGALRFEVERPDRRATRMNQVLVDGLPIDPSNVVFARGTWVQSRTMTPAEVISHTVWLDCRFSLSFGDVEDLPAEGSGF